MIRIAICFFGITRSLTHTIESINTNVLSPSRELGEVRIFAHFFQQAVIDNPRSGEKGALRQDEYALLSPDWLELEKPEKCLEDYDFNLLKNFGDKWNDDFRSLRNLTHQLHSLKRVTAAAIDWSPDIYIFVRPDLYYHDNFRKILIKAVKEKDQIAFSPNWQTFGGLNDRFMICRGKDPAAAFGFRIDQAVRYCEDSKTPLHAERLVAYALRKTSAKVILVRLRASRVRFDGKMRKENFKSGYWKKVSKIDLRDFKSIVKRNLARLKI